MRVHGQKLTLSLGACNENGEEKGLDGNGRLGKLHFVFIVRYRKREIQEVGRWFVVCGLCEGWMREVNCIYVLGSVVAANIQAMEDERLSGCKRGA